MESHAGVVDVSHCLADQRLEGRRTGQIHQWSNLPVLCEEGIQSPGGIVVRKKGEN